MNKKCLRFQLICCFLLLTNLTFANTVYIIGNDIKVSAMSDNGEVVAGVGVYNNDWEVYRWTKSAGIEWLTTPEQRIVMLNSINQDGSLIVGVSDNEKTTPFIWSNKQGVLSIAALNNCCLPLDIDNTGSVIVGATKFKRPFYWSKLQGLKIISDKKGYLQKVSNDGLTAIGSIARDQLFTEAFIWSPQKRIQFLGTLGGNFSIPTDINDDINNKVVVGVSETKDNIMQAFRWTSKENKMQSLGSLGADTRFITAIAVSRDGNTIIGYAQKNNKPVGFIWTLSKGMELIDKYIPQQYRSPDDWTFIPLAISHDGKIIAGEYTHLSEDKTQGWILKID